MPFKVDIRDYSKMFKKTKFFVWQPGQHRFRILEDSAPLFQCYWFGRGFIQANDFDDPQATLNRRIKLENPDNFKTVKGYKQIQDRYYMNVLDLTPVKICPNCEAEVKSVNGTFPATCPACTVGVVANIEAEPLKQVRVLTGGKTLFEQFPTTESKFLDENDEPIDIRAYDCIMHVVGVGSNRSSVVVADTDEDENPRQYPIEVPPEDLFNIYGIVPKVTDEEMEELIRGVSLSDIFAARKEADETDEDAPKADPEQVKKKVDDIFN
jgi:hypothetical protein